MPICKAGCRCPHNHLAVCRSLQPANRWQCGSKCGLLHFLNHQPHSLLLIAAQEQHPLRRIRVGFRVRLTQDLAISAADDTSAEQEKKNGVLDLNQ